MRQEHRLRLSSPPSSLQQNTKQNETFTPNVITLTHEHYEAMVRGMHLPFRAIEGGSVVGPFFWSSFDQDDENPHLRMSLSS